MRVQLACLAAAAAATVPAGAQACSCGQREPREAFREADAAMIGVLEERREPKPDGEFYSSADPVTLVFRVERAYKEELGERLEVRTVRDGASCGIETRVGERTGLYLYREDGEWTSSLCAQASPAEIRSAAAGWPRAAGSGRVGFLVSGEFGAARLLALGRRGRLLAYGRGAGYTRAVAVCPGSRRSVEIFSTREGDGLAVRSLQTLRVIRSVRLRRTGYAELTCTTASGSRSYVAASDRSAENFRLLRVDGRRVKLLARGRNDVVALEPLSLFVVSDARRPLLSWISPKTGRRHRLARLPNDVLSVTPSPDGRRIAVLTADYTVEQSRLTLRLLDWQGNERAVRRMPWESDPEADLAWVDGGRLALVRYGLGRAQLFDTSLRQLRTAARFSAGAALLNGQLYALAGRDLLRWNPHSSHVARLRQLPSEMPGGLVAVPDGPQMMQPARTALRRCG